MTVRLVRERVIRGARRAVAAGTRVGPVEEVLVGLEARLRRDGDELAVLTWHRVDEAGNRPWLEPGLISATPDAFRRQVEWVRRRLRVLSMDDLLAARRRRRLPPRSVVLTFDDGYRDFAEHAWPILRAAGLPATLFVATGAIDRGDSPFWWDRLHAAVRRGDDRVVDTPIGRVDVTSLRDGVAFHGLTGRLKRLPHAQTLAVVGAVERAVDDARGDPADGELVAALAGHAPSMLSADDLRTLAREGVTLAPHTRQHPLLTRVPSAVARDEIAGSRADLERIGVPVAPVLAYPSGAVDDRVTDLVADCGFELAFTTERGLNRLGDAHRLRLRRFNVGAIAGPGLLAGELLWSEGVRARASSRTSPDAAAEAL